jgi:hypothetical protein
MVGVLPSIVVPAFGALLVTISKSNWPILLGFGIAAFSLASALLVAKKVPKST